jgi:acyl-CoA thioesterase FadM
VAGEVVATGRTVQVAYDYQTQQSIPVPAAWREAIAAFEGESLAA